MMRTIRAAMIAGLIANQPAAAEPVDLALVMAVDVSGSVDGEEYALQMRGIAWAVRQPDVIATIQSGRHRRIAINLMCWGEADYEKPSSGWHDISDAASAEAFAAVAERFEGRVGGGTGIGSAIGYGITLVETSGRQPLRKVIDVSGDGTELGEIRDPRFTVSHAQALRAKRGVTVNGLAIQTDMPDLERYYASHVAGGPGSFVMSISSYQDFAEAMHRKLLRELQSEVAAVD
jgi:Protein of unknown function (DUF1194)